MKRPLLPSLNPSGVCSNLVRRQENVTVKHRRALDCQRCTTLALMAAIDRHAPKSNESIRASLTTLRSPPSDDERFSDSPLVGIFRAAASVTARKNPTDGDDIKIIGGSALLAHIAPG